jgi:hypothetical protein
MGALSRWSGGLLNRFSAKWLLTIGPAIAALGIGLLAFSIDAGSYLVVVAPTVIFALGMVVTVAPLTTTVIDAVPTHQTGIASGINNAVSSVANLFAIAILGAVALGVYDHALDKNLEKRNVSAEVTHAVQLAKGQFVVAPALSTVQSGDRRTAEIIIKGSLAESIRLTMLGCALLALAGAACGALLPGARTRQPNSGWVKT